MGVRSKEIATTPRRSLPITHITAHLAIHRCHCWAIQAEIPRKKIAYPQSASPLSSHPDSNSSHPIWIVTADLGWWRTSWIFRERKNLIVRLGKRPSLSRLVVDWKQSLFQLFVTSVFKYWLFCWIMKNLRTLGLEGKSAKSRVQNSFEYISATSPPLENDTPGQLFAM